MKSCFLSRAVAPAAGEVLSRCGVALAGFPPPGGTDALRKEVLRSLVSLPSPPESAWASYDARRRSLSLSWADAPQLPCPLWDGDPSLFLRDFFLRWAEGLRSCGVAVLGLPVSSAEPYVTPDVRRFRRLREVRASLPCLSFGDAGLNEAWRSCALGTAYYIRADGTPVL